MRVSLYVASLALLMSTAAAFAEGAPSGTKFDGVYVGSKTQVGGRGCSSAGESRATVRSGMFRWGVPPSQAAISIAADGSIYGVAGNLVVKGQMTGNAMDFDSTTPGCSNKWHLEKR